MPPDPLQNQTPVNEAQENVNMSASALVKSGAGALLGIFCASGSSPTLKVWDSESAAGRVIVNTFTPTPGLFHPIPGKFKVGCYVTIGGTADITVFYA